MCPAGSQQSLPPLPARQQRYAAQCEQTECRWLRDEGARVEKERMGGRLNGSARAIRVVGAEARDPAGVADAVGLGKKPLGAFGWIDGVKPGLQIDHLPVHARSAGVNEAVGGRGVIVAVSDHLARVV